ncbi:MAG: hypothetical protein MdMp024_0450 [Bacteroidales bacterium]
MKQYVFLYALCACIVCPFVSCESEQEDLPPAKGVSDLAFEDTDAEPSKIGGTLSWLLPEPETNIDGYVVYLSETATAKGTLLGEVNKGTTSFTVPAGTPFDNYLQVVARNAVGESTNIISVAVTDWAEEVRPPQTAGLYILNRGNWNENNASLSYYDVLSRTMTTDVYKQANGGSGLGDSAEQLLIYGSKMYITVTMSNRLVVLDLSGKLIAEYKPEEEGNPMHPRGLAAYNGKVYVGYYYGHAVAAFDTAALAIENVVPVGRYPERLTAAGGKIYVANSGGPDFPNYGKTVSVINPATMQVEKEIEVAINPTQVTADSAGNVYVVSMGDYASVPSTLQRIDAATQAVSAIGEATAAVVVGNMLYTLYAPYGATEIAYKKRDIAAGSVADLITDGTPIAAPNHLAVDPLTGKIYITTFEYGSVSSLYIFSSEGKLEQIVDDTGGFDAASIAFIVKE